VSPELFFLVSQLSTHEITRVLEELNEHEEGRMHHFNLTTLSLPSTTATTATHAAATSTPTKDPQATVASSTASSTTGQVGRSDLSRRSIEVSVDVLNGFAVVLVL
jgi:hypothetical protein